MRLRRPGPARCGAAEFAGLIETLGPFEQRPRLAVAVSGGPDSLCLCLLAAGWAAAQDGAVSALIVDHGLRPEAAAEARQVAAWLRARRIDHHVLRWAGVKPATGIQAAAREARYRLLGDWCRAAGILHLLLGHHLDDQAETVALREARQSGAEGLAGMAAVRELAGLRLLRPFLRGAEDASAGDSDGAGASRGSRIRATSRRRSHAGGCAAARGWTRHASPGARHEQARRRAANDDAYGVLARAATRASTRRASSCLPAMRSGRRRQRSGAAPSSRP